MDVGRSSAKKVGRIDAIGNQAPAGREDTQRKAGRQMVLGCQSDDQVTMSQCHEIQQDQESAITLQGKRADGPLEVSSVASRPCGYLNSQSRSGRFDGTQLPRQRGIVRIEDDGYAGCTG